MTARGGFIPSGSTRAHALTLILLLCLSVFLFAACGGGGTGEGGATAITSRGRITGFGSVFVNGVEFETTQNIIVDGVFATEADLSLGMVVTVEGLVNPDGVTGIANEIIFDGELKGPIADVPIADPDNIRKAFTVLGQTVTVEKNETVFDDVDPSFTFETIAQGDLLEVSGFLDTNGVLSATYIEKKGVLSTGTTAVKVSGLISGFEGSDTFSLGILTVTFDPTGANTDLADVPGGTIVNGLLVEVKGNLATAVEMSTTKIEVKERDF